MLIARLKAARFQTKVLVPVVLVMVSLVAVTMYVVSRRLTAQFHNEAKQALQTADAVFRNSQKSRQRTLQKELRNIPLAPQYIATFQRADPGTIAELLDKSRVQIPGDLVVYTAVESNKTLAVSRRDTALDTDEFERNSALSTKKALGGEAAVDTIRVNDLLFDVVSLPVKLPVSGEVIGALTFCLRFGEAQAQELSETTGCGIVLIANNRIVASSFRRQELLQQCIDLFGSAGSASSREALGLREISAPRESYLPRIGIFDSLNGDTKLGYVLLYSSEAAAQELAATQRTIVVVSLIGIMLATAIVWFLIRQSTRPLRELRDSAEAVGRGDFTQRVNVASQDECGELARVFNRMTENLQGSRAQLEQTVTSLKTTQAQLIQSEKLSAIGEFVAGVTHELNNPLTSLLGFSELLQQTNCDERQRRFADRITNSARRCQKIVQSLLSFARRQAPERKVSSVNDLMEAVIEILAYEMRTSNIEVVKQFGPETLQALVDPHQIQQVFLNIVNNARQAMEAHQHSGRLVIRTEAAHGWVRVTFQDNGPGITEANLKKIFDPFFTTKEAGKGTGLGLSLSYGIVQEHGGTIRAESKPGTGATFIIELPAHAGNACDTEQGYNNKPVTASASGGSKRILVIDDEESILDFVAEVLTGDGHEVDTARDGETALKQLRQRQYDLALCDWKMPGMNGQNLYERIRHEDPAAAQRFIFMTGDVVTQKTNDFLKDEHKACLAKPFSIADFRSVVGSLAEAA